MGTGLAVLLVVDSPAMRDRLSSLLLRGCFQVRAIDRRTAEAELLSGKMECPDVVVQLSGDAPDVLDRCPTCHDRSVWVEPAHLDPEQDILTGAIALAKKISALIPHARISNVRKPGYRSAHFGIVAA